MLNPIVCLFLREIVFLLINNCIQTFVFCFFGSIQYYIHNILKTGNFVHKIYETCLTVAMTFDLYLRTRYTRKQAYIKQDKIASQTVQNMI